MKRDIPIDVGHGKNVPEKKQNLSGKNLSLDFFCRMGYTVKRVREN